MTVLNTPIRAVVFDLDDTLFPERQYVGSGFRAVGEHLRRQLHRDERFEDWLWARFERGEYAGAFDALSEQFHLKFTARQIEAMVKVYREHRPRISPFGGVGEMLGRLHADYRLGLLSDGYLPAQRLKYGALKLEPFFEAVVFTEELGRDAWKPSPTGFEEIARVLDVPHERCAYVGDNPAKDFVAPNALGWRTIQFLHPGQVHADNSAPEGGRPKFTARLPGDLHNALVAREP